MIEADVLNELGKAYQKHREAGQARNCFQQALQLDKDYKDLRADMLYNLASLDLQCHQSTAALDHARQAVSLLEELRAGLGGYGESKSALLATKLPVYYLCLDLILQNGRVEEAFTLAQKTKGRALLDLLASGRVDLDSALTEDEKRRQQDLRLEADSLNEQMIKEGVQNEVGSKKRFAALQQQQQEVERKLQTLTDMLYARHPGLADKQIAGTATLSSLASVLPADTALLDYIVLSDKKLALFVVTNQQGQARVKAYILAVTEARLRQECADFRAACADPRKDYRPLAIRLFHLLLAPASAQMAGKGRLVLCPDGPLWNVPFQVLTLPSTSRAVSGNRAHDFLWQHYDLAYAYSATGAQAALRIRARQVSQPTGTLMVMANPDFGSSKRFGDLDDLPGQRPLTDPSRPLAAASRPLPDSSRPLTDPSRPLTDPTRPITDPSRPLSEPSRSLLLPSRQIVPPSRTITTALEVRGGGIASLPGTQREADALYKLFPDAEVFTGKAAQESTAKEQMGKFKYLHFATHGFLNDAAPLLSSIVLAQPDKSDPKAGKEDGFLTAREVFDLQLQADLVTLSACNTGRGSIRTGEGMVGLSWAFFVAGVPTQVVSQWSVDDAATAQLMSAFYSHLKAGEGKSQALREAALSLQKEKGHQHPYYWAPFLLMGDWRR